MTDDTPTHTDIESRVEQIEAVIERLEAGELSLADATEQYETAKDELESLRADLAVGDGQVTEHTPADVPDDATD